MEWGAIGAPESEYQVYVRSKNANGGPVYSQIKTVTCPALSAPDYNGPNVPENFSWWQKLFVYLGAADGSSPSPAAASLLYFGGTDYALNRVSRSCETATDETTGMTIQTCDEVWNEYITVRLDESSFDETLADLVDTYIPDEEVKIAWRLAKGRYDLYRLWKDIEKFGTKKAAAKLSVRLVAGAVVTTYGLWLYNEGTAPYAEINGIGSCVFKQPENRGNDIKNWSAISVNVSVSESVGNIRSIRNAIVHYCKESK